jgi:transposase
MERHEINKRDVGRIEKALQAAKGNEWLYRHIQMVYLRAAQGMTQPEIAKACGVSLSTVNRAHMAWFRKGMVSFELQPRGGRLQANMSLDEEKAFLAKFIHQAGAGELVCIQDIRKAYEQKIGHPTGSTTIYSLLERHGWRKLMPRPHHPRRDIRAQKRFKKTSNA